ncbi:MULTISPECIES: prolyl aminopeptidase [unclassified Aureimonas]|uniref:prolyl aminopeptidase n=1 Tax=unclassified Aureimonas TaxID=2615206 RepID=UPI0006FC1FBA|nr:MULTISPECIES: prolyl aminopeptidase [unclassified Aureimonas]KQT55330.1 proline iminopeptidase [Aureimonas sp. Leaf427]KQT71121.1 proline iminopeptidase [Aureimonas sp. Leaf460]
MVEPPKPYPPIEPYKMDRLDVGDGHTLYYELCGNPEGRPVVFLHGGPGSGFGSHHRRLFDPKRYHILLFDQRGAGRSMPQGELEANTTWHLVADLERLRLMMGVERWMLFGGSWGATLALAYAETHPERVTAMVLRGVFSGRRSELDWFFRDGANRLFPELWEAFLGPLDAAERHEPLQAYRLRLTSPDAQVRSEAAGAWAAWEGGTVMLRRDAGIGPAAPPRKPAPAGESTIAFARIENHYFIHDLWLEEGQLLRDAGRLAGIPGVIVQGRYDVVTPAATGYALHKAWPGSEHRMVEGAGHAFSEPGILAELLAATGRFADE